MSAMTDPRHPCPRFLEPGVAPFDPVELASRTEEIVCRGDSRKYTKFRRVGVYGGIATGYTCGCCMRCVFCWVDRSRDFPEQHGEFHSPESAFRRLSRVAHRAGVDQLRVSGAEPTLGKQHLLRLLEIVEKSPFRLFILETNGILLGADQEYARQIAPFKKVHTRVSLKAGTPEAFARKTGATLESFELPLRGIVKLLEAGADFHVASMTADSRIVSRQERLNLLQRLAAIDPSLIRNLEEEAVHPYPAALRRLQHARLHLAWE
jgi:uncharacterized Fe-S cluster-containing radical SAM superfamily protein